MSEGSSEKVVLRGSEGMLRGGGVLRGEFAGVLRKCIALREYYVSTLRSLGY